MSVRAIRRRRRRSLLRRAAAFGVGVAGTAVLAPQPPASGYFTQPDTSCFTAFQLSFVGGNWGSRSGQFAAGGELWNGIQRRQGGPWVAVGSWGDGGWIDAFREELGGNTSGRADCGAGRTWLDVGVAAGGPTEAVGVHEIGHLLGMEHTGDDDSVGSSVPPAMSTCRTFSTAQLGQDDNGQLTHMRDVQHANEHKASAGVGFENQILNWWGRDNLDMTIVTGTQAKNGQAFAELSAPSSGGSEFRLYQTTRHVDLHDVYGVRLDYKDASTDTTGWVGVRISSRGIDYPYQDPDDCGYFSDFDLNRPSFPSTVMTYRAALGACNTENGWDSCTSLNHGDYNWAPPSSWDGAEIRLNVYKNTNGTIWVDDVMLEAE